jgi:pilus assembly protein Flp/PilA
MEIPMPLTNLVSEVIRHAGVRGGVFYRLIRDERGVTAIEYTLIAALIALAFVALIAQIGDFVSTPFETVAGKL